MLRSAEASLSPELTEMIGIPRSEDFARNDTISGDAYS